MRIVHVVCSVGFAGVERYLVNLSPGLVERGSEVTVIGGDRERMTAALAGTGVEWRPGDSMRQALRSLRDVASPDVINTHMSQADLVGALGRSTARHRAVHVSTRHFMGRRGTAPLSRAVLGIADRSIRGEIAISSAVAAFAHGDVEVVHTGVPVSTRTKTREKTVLVAQRLESEKDTATAIDAWALSHAPKTGWVLRVAGDGTERAELEERARERGVAERVEFLGHREDVPELLRSASIVLAPTPREGLGILVLEAMAEGTPVVAAAGGGHLETIGSVSPQTLFEPGDAMAAARIIDQLVDDPARRAALGGDLQTLQRREFTIDAQITATMTFYRRMLDT
ncbi:glycosyltransferase family 4 protein [Microbacterium kyungheense]|uniref:Glycosyltransferase involved in cell wall biosynthesis n=1 Tax=Microbacterium kyungheense TaxID=1263636 RepID=A0A543ERS9_9MICO|nr:glycosyltransferase family 4 protein [Microbacterium kyungheense]TQM24280.1 glycosyltransferase involved in cell wall biosynthesis [Microbacterium kyungheense]